MERDARLGYGFLFVGYGVPYLADKLAGPTVAAFAAGAMLIVGVVFLVSAHHPNNKRTLKMAIWIFTLYGAGIGALGGGLFGAISKLRTQAKSTANDVGPIAHSPADRKENEQTPLATPPVPARAVPKTLLPSSKPADNPMPDIMLAYPRLADGPEPYKNFTHAQMGQLAIDESDRVFNLASAASNRAWEMRQTSNTQQLANLIDKDFSDQFAECCAKDLVDIRTEILKRLPAPNKLVDETKLYDAAMNLILPNDRRGRYRSDLLKLYVPKLRSMGEAVKRSMKPRESSRRVGFTTEKVLPEVMTPIGNTNYWTKITIGDDMPMGIGYLVIVGNPRTDLNTSSRIDPPFERLPPSEEITNPEFARFIAGNRNALALQIGEGSISQTHPASVYLATTTEIVVQTVTFYGR